MGGGVHVELSIVSATFRTDNFVSFTRFQIIFNRTERGVGGGISVLYRHSRYQGNIGVGVVLNTVTIFHNIAASGSACAFQSLPTHGKWLFRGVRIINTVALLAEYPNNLKEAISKLYTVDPVKMFTDSINQATAFLRKQLLQTINPTFQVKSNTNLIFGKSVQITLTTGILAIFVEQDHREFMH